jgi:hypothetical protein
MNSTFFKAKSKSVLKKSLQNKEEDEERNAISV